MKTMAKPKKIYASEEIAQVEALAAYGHTQEEITEYLGIKVRSFAYAKKENEALNAAYTRGRFKARNLVASKFMRYIESDELNAVNLKAIEFYLRTQAGWSDKQELNVNTKDVTPPHPPTIINHFIEDYPKNTSGE